MSDRKENVPEPDKVIDFGEYKEKNPSAGGNFDKEDLEGGDKVVYIGRPEIEEDEEEQAVAEVENSKTEIEQGEEWLANVTEQINIANEKIIKIAKESGLFDKDHDWEGAINYLGITIE